MFQGKNQLGNEYDYIDWIRLYRSANVGTKTFWQLIKMFDNPTKALANLEQLATSGGIGKKYIAAKRQDVEREIVATEKFGAKIITAFDQAFPKQLLNISDCPPLLVVKGKIELLSKPQIAIVGSRNASFNGCQLATDIAQDLGKKGYIVTSGLARGIDAASHQGAIKTGTVAVIAGGINHVYPVENQYLYKMIYEAGTVISEAPFNTSPIAKHFPQRNRIISGLSTGVLVVEAARKSGTLITVNFALEQGREVFAIPGSPLDPRCQGTNQLIKQGAILVESADDITNNFRSNNDLFSDKKNYFSDTNLSGIDENMLNKYRDSFINCISYSPTSIEKIATYSNIPINVINCLVVELELAGRIMRTYGNKVQFINITK